MEKSVIDIAIADILPPQVEMRTQYIQEDLEALAHSIKMYGLMSPVIVRMVGEKYELIAGWRRTRAHEMLGIPIISAIVESYSDSDTDMVRMHENLMREEVNPVDEGMYYSTIMKKHNWQVADISLMVKRSNGYVISRLKLIDCDDDLRDAVKDGVISMSVALELHRIDDVAQRNRLLSFILRSGATAEQVRKWRVEYEINSKMYKPHNNSMDPSFPDGSQRSENEMPGLNEGSLAQVHLQESVIEYKSCYNCLREVPYADAKMLVLCPECAEVLEKAIRGEVQNTGGKIENNEGN